MHTARKKRNDWKHVFERIEHSDKGHNAHCKSVIVTRLKENLKIKHEVNCSHYQHIKPIFTNKLLMNEYSIFKHSKKFFFQFICPSTGVRYHILFVIINHTLFSRIMRQRTFTHASTPRSSRGKCSGKSTKLKRV